MADNSNKRNSAEMLIESDRVQKAAAMSAKNRRQKRKMRLFGGAAAIVVFITTYMLILPAITLEHTPTCGYEEHTHTAECYAAAKELTCGLEESAGHTHSEACYQTEQLLACGLEEGEDHAHSGACYESIQSMICGLEEYTGHTHADACFTESKVLTCTLPEHVHTDACYPAAEDPSASEESAAEEEEESLPSGDSTADIESAADWEATLANVELTGNWGEDVIAIAKSQLGYRESTANFISYRDENDNVVTKGYSRYGAWYGSPYGDWCAMFCSFCLNYAKVPTSAMPQHSGCPAWITLLNSRGQYHSASAGYVPKAGDLIFYDWESNNDCDHVALVEKCEDGVVYTIEGNFGDMVTQCKYNYGDYRIMGYGELPENPDYEEPEETALLSVQSEEEDEYEEEEDEASFLARLFSAFGGDFGVSLMSDDGTSAPHDFKNNITGIFVSVNGNYLSPTDGAYQLKQNDDVKFEIEYTLPGHTLDNTNTITYNVPTNGLTAQSGTVTGTINGQTKPAGTYTVTTDGKVTIVFNEEFVTQNQAGYPIEGTIALHQNATSITGSDTNSGEIKFNDSFDYHFEITDRTIYNADLTLTKSQGTVENGKVTYTIVLYTTKGTDGQTVNLTDTLSKMHISGNVTIKNGNGAYVTPVSSTAGQSSLNYVLPAMSAGDKYVISYQAEVNADETAEIVTGTNTAKAEFTDTKGVKYEPSQTITTNFDRTVISKNGSQNGNKIDWTITVNNSHQDIAGWELSDEMMKGVDITVNGGSASDYTYDKTNGKLTFADNGTNTNTYTITFSTPVTEEQYGTNVTNTATLKDKYANPHTADKTVYVSKPAEVQPLWKTGEKQSDGSIRWKISINGISPRIDLTNLVLTDEALKTATDIQVVRDWNSYTDTSNDYTLDTTNGTITFKAIDSDGVNKHYYDVYYTTHPDYVIGKNTFTNVGQLSGYSEVTSTVDGGTITPGSKTGNGTTVENETVIANWHATIGGSFEIPGPWKFQDWLDENSGYFTMAQLKEVEAYIRSTGITNFTMKAFTDSAQYKDSDAVTVTADATSDKQFKKYVINFTDTLAKGTVLSWDYHSTGAGKDQTQTLTNHAKLNDKYQYDATVTYESTPVLKKTNLYGDTLKFTEDDPSKNYINWLLEINIPEGTTDTEWTITEHVPEGLNPVYIEPVLNQNGYPADDSFSFTTSGRNDDGDYIIKFNPSLYAGQTKYIKVAGLVRESEIPMNADKTKAVKVYGNSATITYTDGKTYDVGPVEKTVEREYVDNTLAKGATFDSETGIITYHIDIDPSKVVDEEDKSYSVVDEITYQDGNCKLEIIPGSIVVTETLTGRALGSAECLVIEGEPWSNGWQTRQKIYFTIVSDQPICIEYKYQYTDVTQQLWGHGVSNHVTLENSRGWKSETENQTNNNYKASEATATVNSYPVYKVDAADHTTFLPGATFTIYKWDNSSQSYVQDTTAVTQADGSLRNPNGFTRNVAYKIVETAAPTGYQVNTTPVEFYIKDKNTVKYPMSVPEDFSGTAMSPGGVLYFEDTRVEGNRDTQISVKKNWEDHLGNDISSNVSTDVQFTLHRIEKRYNGSGGASGSDAIPGVVVKFQYSDGSITTMYLENAKIGDSITAKLTSSWQIYDESGNLNSSYTPPSVNGVQISGAAGYNSADRSSFYAPITANARIITIDIPYTRYNGSHAIALDCYVVSSSGGGGSSLIGTYDTVVGTYTVTKSGSYEWNSQTLPAYRVNGDGTTSTYTYYIEEIGVQGYLTSYDRNDSTNGVSAGTITITNTQPNEDEDTEISLQKVWKDSAGNTMIDEEKPENAVIEVWQVANGDKANAVQLTDKTVTLDSSNSWKTTLTGLPKVRKSGNDVTSYTYYFVEQTQAGYEVTYSNGDTALSQGTVIITNKKTDNPEDTDTSVTAEKVWKDSKGNTIDAPAGQTIILDLYQIIDDGEPTKLEDQSITLPYNGSWSKTIENLPLTRVDEEDSTVEHQYKYYFVEREVPAGYKVQYSASASQPITSGTQTITNIKKNQTSVTVSKQWFRNVNGSVTEITDRTGSIEFDLYWVKTPTGSTEPDTPTHEHTWNEGVVTTEPGEYTEGVRTYTCTGCGETRTEPIGALGHTHNWSSSVTAAATCASTGVRTYTCSGCNETYTEPIDIDSTNHTGETYIDGAYAATETTAGYTGDTKCSGCNATLATGEVIPATGGGGGTGESYTVTIQSSQWNNPITYDTVSVTEGQSIEVQFKTTVSNPNVGWYEGSNPNAKQTLENTLISQEQYYPDPSNPHWIATKYTYKIVFKPTATCTMFLNYESTDEVISINVTGVESTASSPARAARRLASSAGDADTGTTNDAGTASTPSETPSIPDGAEKLGTYQLFSNRGWTDTFYFDAEDGYTYTYYVVEKDAGNYSVAYEGEGTSNLTIKNTITEQTYSLPGTGGAGTRRFTIAGLAIMAAAFVIGLSSRRKRERRTEF